MAKQMIMEFTGQQKKFIRDYIAEINSGDAAIFAGAGLSASAGFVTIMIMIVGYSIPDGIAAGFIVYVFSKLFTKNVKDITPSVWAMFVLFVLHFALK